MSICPFRISVILSAKNELSVIEVSAIEIIFSKQIFSEHKEVETYGLKTNIADDTLTWYQTQLTVQPQTWYQTILSVSPPTLHQINITFCIPPKLDTKYYLLWGTLKLETKHYLLYEPQTWYHTTKHY